MIYPRMQLKNLANAFPRGLASPLTAQFWTTVTLHRTAKQSSLRNLERFRSSLKMNRGQPQEFPLSKAEAVPRSQCDGLFSSVPWWCTRANSYSAWTTLSSASASASSSSRLRNTETKPASCGRALLGLSHGTAGDPYVLQGGCMSQCSCWSPRPLGAAASWVSSCMSLLDASR